MRRPLIVANWKMNNTVPEALKFVAALTSELKAVGHADVAIAPPFTALYSMGVALAETGFALAAQDLFWEDRGAYTGEVSGAFLRDVGCSMAIVAHSERRQLFGEGDEQAALKVKAALRHGLVPILCVGETLAEREAGRARAVIERQVRGGLKGIAQEVLAGIVIAYEPVWAIGTGRTAPPSEAQEMHAFIRGQLAAVAGGAADEVRVIYGGSVKPSNSRELMAEEDISGALVGGASLDAKQFAAIVRGAH